MKRCLQFCKDLENMIRTLLDIHRLETANLALDLTDTDSVALMNEEFEKIRPIAASKQIGLTVYNHGNIPPVAVDRNLFGRVISNLLSNAIRHTPKGGKVEGSVESLPDPKRICLAIKDTGKGPEVWEVKWAVFWRKKENGLPSRRHCLIVARNVLTGEMKYFLSNRVPGEWNPHLRKYVTLRWLLRVAFGRWTIESCFREGKEELGMDHYETRGWRCVHVRLHLREHLGRQG